MTWRRSVRAKILVPLIVLFVLLEAAAITGAALVAKDVAQLEAVDEMRTYSHRLATHLNGSVESRVLAIELAARAIQSHQFVLSHVDDPAARAELDARNVQPVLEGYSRAGFEELILADASGTPTAAYADGIRVDHESAASARENLASEPCFLSAQHADGVYVSPVGAAPGSRPTSEGGSTGRSRLCVSAAYRDASGGVAGVVVGIVNVHRLIGWKPVGNDPDGLFVYSLAHGPLTGGSGADAFAITDVTAMPQEFWDGGSTTVTGELAGEPHAGVVTLVRKFSTGGAPSDYWYVVAVTSDAAVGGAAVRLAGGIAVASFLALTAVATALWVAVERAMRPIHRLTETATLVGSGDFDARVEVDSADELKDLATAFNDMVRGLRERDGKLRDYSQRLVQTEKFAAIGTLAAGVAHEINNPLAFIKGNEQLAETLLEPLTTPGRVDDDARADLAEVRESLRVNATGVSRIELIIQSLRQFAKPSTHKQSVSLRGIVDSTLTLSQNRLKGSGIHVDVDIPDDAPDAIGNPDELGQVVLNLLVNATESFDGRVGRISFRTGEENGLVVLEVEDDGAGIPFDLQQKLFTPFVTTKANGTGLGLSISRRIVEEHGGSLTFTSAPGEGTTFRMSLPRASRTDDDTIIKTP